MGCFFLNVAACTLGAFLTETNCTEPSQPDFSLLFCYIVHTSFSINLGDLHRQCDYVSEYFSSGLFDLFA